MFLTDMGGEEFALKPMNCPPTMLYYRTRRWSFRELPLRVSCFDSLYRNELSGVASGLFRVKSFSQDDAHIFATDDQVEGEVKGMIDLMDRVFKIFGLEYKLNLSTMPDEHLGTRELWEKAESTLARVMEAKGLKYKVKDKDGAFYGPKIDVDIKDSMGREWQNSTIQLDYQLPQRFKLTYAGSDGKEHTPVVIHRAILGSLERFIGVYLEHVQGRFPVWIAPVQVRVLPVSDESKGYADKVAEKLAEGGIRVERDLASGTIGGKIRDAQLQKIPYMLVIGSKEEQAQLGRRQGEGRGRQVRGEAGRFHRRGPGEGPELRLAPEGIEASLRHDRLEGEVEGAEHLVEHRARVLDVLFDVDVLRLGLHRGLDAVAALRLHERDQLAGLHLLVRVPKEYRGLHVLGESAHGRGGDARLLRVLWPRVEE